MSEYTPPTDFVRRDYAEQRDREMFSPTFEKAKTFRASGGGAGEFDRWLAEHDRAVAEAAAKQALEDAKAALREYVGELVHHENPDPGYSSMVRASVANWKHGPARGYSGGIEAALEILRARAASISTDKAGDK